LEREDRSLESLPVSTSEKIKIEGGFQRKKSGFATLLIGISLLTALFAAGTLWIRKGGADWFGEHAGIDGTPSQIQTSENPDGTAVPPEKDSPGNGSAEEIVSIRTEDLSCSSLGIAYLQNESVFSPDVQSLLAMKPDGTVAGSDPLVLILHTHTSESYFSSDAARAEGELGDLARSDDESQNMLAVGEALCETLNRFGIVAIHCREVYDASGVGGSYQRAAESIRRYLTLYPTIRYVIDLHRDLVIEDDGTVIRSQGCYGEEEVAQIRAVVGTDATESSSEWWEKNLALALQLRARLDADGATVCRPVKLAPTSLNQELAPYSLHLEIGTAANSPKEAKLAAVLVGETLAELLYEP